MNMRIKNGNKFEVYSISLILIYFIVISYINLINKTVWYDEAYSIALIKYSYQEIWNITASDVHPPLYYFLLKSFSSIFGNSLFSLRTFSAIGIILVFIVSFFQIRQLFGKVVSFSYSFIIAILPVSQYLGVEIRMYSWLLFFILAASLYGYKILQSNSRLNYILFTLFAIFGGYTHNYGLIAIGTIYLYLIVYKLKYKQPYYQLIISCCIFLIIYGCWVPHLYQQIIAVKNDFWIEPITPKDILLFCYYFFSPKEPSHPYLIFSKTSMTVALMTTLIILAYFIYLILIKNKENKDSRKKAAFFFLYIFVSTIGLALIVSFVFKPILVSRFTNSVLAPLILSTVLYSRVAWNRINGIKSICYSIILIFCVLSCSRFLSEKKYYELMNSEKVQLVNFVKGCNKQNTFVAPHSLYPELAKLSLLFPDSDFYLYSPSDTTNYQPFRINVTTNLPNVDTILQIESKIVNNMKDCIVTKKFDLEIKEKYSLNKKISISDFEIQQMIKK